MSPTSILVVASASEVIADGVAAAVRHRSDLRLASERVLTAGEVAPLLALLDLSRPLAILLVGEVADDEALSGAWMQAHREIVVVRVTLMDNIVHFDASHVGLESLLSMARELALRQGAGARQRSTSVFLHAGAAAARPLLAAALAWVHAVMAAALVQQPSGDDDVRGIAISAASLQGMLAAGPAGARADAAAARDTPRDTRCDGALLAALRAADPASEPLKALYQNLELDVLEWELLLLALAPACDLRYQRCIGFLLDDPGRRAGTLTLFAAMLDDPAAVRRSLSESGRLARWRLLGIDGAVLPAADDGLQLDPSVLDWLFGNGDALAGDARLRRVLRATPWPGAALLRTPQQRAEAARLAASLQPGAPWPILSGADLAGWRALLELGGGPAPLRCELARFAADDLLEAEEIAIRLARCARLSGRALVIDADLPDGAAADDALLPVVTAALAAAGCTVTLLGADAGRLVAAAGAPGCILFERAEPDRAARVAVVRAAASGLGVELEDGAAAAIGGAYPVAVDGMAQAARLAAARMRGADTAHRQAQLLRQAFRGVASQRLSRLAQHITPTFQLGQVVLPAEHKQQLEEIVNNVRLAPKVFDDWRFGERVPYGRGVAALFHGSSGTGKTMAAQAVACELGIDIYALDLSRVVSKYIGETERNIDAVFADAERSGAAVLIDEADALLGKRSEVKDAHDRYANIEVAYLLQRMEAFPGLAILTSNIRQNIDQAFLRRLRFVLEFPRPDLRARADIWRLCLPEDSHDLGAQDILLLARQAELTGGHIRQITLRAAFAAAADSAGSKIGLVHLQPAINAELAKLGLPAVNFLPVGMAA